MVQFVELRRFLNKSTGTWDKEALARAVLAEIPAQVRGSKSTSLAKEVLHRAVLAEIPAQVRG